MCELCRCWPCDRRCPNSKEQDISELNEDISEKLEEGNE